jgi:REP-associated tyrosine transposase
MAHHAVVLMPDHLHALLSFARDDSMSSIIGNWKRFHAGNNGLRWQEGYFDRPCERTSEASNLRQS